MSPDARASRFALQVDSTAFVLGVFIALAGAAATVSAVLCFVLLRAKMNWYEYEDFPMVTMLTCMIVPVALLLLSVGWSLARRGARRLVSPATSLRIQAVLVRGLGVLLLLPALLIAVAWFHDRFHIDTELLEPDRWGYRFVVFSGLASVSCLLGAFAQLLRPPRIGPFLFGAALLLGATVVYQYVRLGTSSSMEAFFTSFLLGWACGITLLLAAPWRRLRSLALLRRRVVLEE